jgi:hypothetical protein
MNVSRLVRYVAWLSVFAGSVVARGDWIHGWMGYPADETSHTAHLHIITVASTNGHLSGHFLFVNGSSTTVTLEGTPTAGESLSTSATAQIAADPGGGEFDWKTIGECVTPEGATTLKTIAPHGEQSLTIDMDVFRDSVRNAGYGRVLLKNGCFAIFELERIAPK